MTLGDIFKIQNCLDLKPMLFSLHYPFNTDHKTRIVQNYIQRKNKVPWDINTRKQVFNFHQMQTLCCPLSDHVPDLLMQEEKIREANFFSLQHSFPLKPVLRRSRETGQQGTAYFHSFHLENTMGFFKKNSGTSSHYASLFLASE